MKYRLFDIIELRQDQVQLGLYIGNLDGFDPAGKTTPEIRSNVIEKIPSENVK